MQVLQPSRVFQLFGLLVWHRGEEACVKGSICHIWIACTRVGNQEYCFLVGLDDLNSLFPTLVILQFSLRGGGSLADW